MTGPGVALQVIGRLFFGGIGWLAFMLSAMLAGFLGGSSAGSSWIGLAYMLGICVLLWVLFPVFDFLSRK